MAKVYGKYNLLEVLENPQRIKSISMCALNDLAYDALVHDQLDRFTELMVILQRMNYGIYLSFVICASDLFPTNVIFKEQLGKFTTVEKSSEAGTLLNNLLNLIDRMSKINLVNNEKQKDIIFQTFTSTLPEDSYEFLKSMMSKEHHEMYFKAFKHLYSKNIIDPKSQNFFSFCMKRNFENVYEQSSICIPIKEYKILTCIRKLCSPE